MRLQPTARTRQTSQDTLRRVSHDTGRSGPPPYEWVRDSLGADGASDSLLDDEKLAQLRRGRDRRRKAGRGGWGRLALIIGLLLLVAIGFGVGLGVGLARKKSGSGQGRSDGDRTEHSAGSTSGTPLTQQFPLGEYSMITSLRTVATDCTSASSTWRPNSVTSSTAMLSKTMRRKLCVLFVQLNMSQALRS